MSVVPSSEWTRSIARMKLLTVFGLAVTGLAIFAWYTHTHKFGEFHEEAARAPVAKPEALTPEPERQQTTVAKSQQEQADTAKAESKDLDDVLVASREQVIAAIQEPIQGTDLRQTLRQATAGVSGAQYEMALRYVDGNGVPQNHQDAMEWFTRAADAGNADAQWKLGLGYLKGIGVPLDERQAIAWFKRAANNGDVRAQQALGEMYFSGRGAPRDYVRAYTWANIAMQQKGNDEGQLRTIRSRMTPNQVADAERRIAIWRDNSNREGQRTDRIPKDLPHP